MFLPLHLGLVNDDTVGRLLDVFIYRDRAYGVGGDASRCRIFDVCYSSTYVGIDRRIFKGPVTRRVKRAILKHKVMRIAQWLLAGYMAIDQPQVA